MRNLLLVGLLCLSFTAKAQTPVVTQPQSVISFNAASSITTTDTFQSLWAANVNRRSCTIQNNASNAMYVFFGAIASATKDTSVKLSTGQSVNCNVGNIVLGDQVSITGTSADKFFAAQQ